ncbi:MAG TPA: tetratricopeptide repeat protein, partial [Blastocatellia bacterium]
EDEFEQSFLKARDLAAHQDFKGAITEFQHAAGLKKGKCADCYRAIGEAYIHLKSYKDAAGAYRQALTMDPGNPAELYNSLGVALYFAGEKDKESLNQAIEAFKQAIKLSNNTLEQAYFNLGSALLRLGKRDEGIEAMKTYLKLAPRGPDAKQAQMAIDNAGTGKSKR